MNTIIKTLPYSRDNNLNAFEDYSSISVRQNKESRTYFLNGSGVSKSKKLTEQQFLECCVNLFYQQGA